MEKQTQPDKREFIESTDTTTEQVVTPPVVDGVQYVELGTDTQGTPRIYVSPAFVAQMNDFLANFGTGAEE